MFSGTARIQGPGCARAPSLSPRPAAAAATPPAPPTRPPRSPATASFAGFGRAAVPACGAMSASSSPSRAAGARPGHRRVAPAARKEVGHVEAGAAAHHARRSLLEQRALDQLGLRLVRRRPRTSSPSVNSGLILRARACASLRGASAEPSVTSGMPQRGQKAPWVARSPHAGQWSSVADDELFFIGLAVANAPRPHLRLTLERDDQVDPVGIESDVDVRLGRLGRAARVRVVDGDTEAIVVERVRGEKALLSSSKRVGEPKTFSARVSSSARPSTRRR